MAVVFEGYFDESGDFDTLSKIFCISGYLIETEKARVMDQEWGSVLENYNLPYFHMVDCAHGNGVFAKIERAERIEIVTRLIALIKKYTMAGFSVVMHGDHFERSEKYPDPYSSSVDVSILALFSFLDVNRIKDDIAYFFETGHGGRGRAYHHVGARLKQASGSLTFAAKEQVRLLQAADLLAWQTTKYLKDKISGQRPPRQDFLSLMEHEHSIAYVTIKEGESELAIENWPVSRRSKLTASMTMDKDGPITLVREAGSPLPLILVKDLNGWREGPGRMACVSMTDIGDKNFELGFDLTRTMEAIGNLIGSCSIWGPSDIALDASDMVIEAAGSETYVRLKFSGGESIRFKIPHEVIARVLKEQSS